MRTPKKQTAENFPSNKVTTGVLGTCITSTTFVGNTSKVNVSSVSATNATI